jgi:hypothetical protein
MPVIATLFIPALYALRKRSETFEPPKPNVFDSTFVIAIGRGVWGM